MEGVGLLSSLLAFFRSLCNVRRIEVVTNGDGDDVQSEPRRDRVQIQNREQNKKKGK